MTQHEADEALEKLRRAFDRAESGEEHAELCRQEAEIMRAIEGKTP
jgi:hypothetical protein